MLPYLLIVNRREHRLDVWYRGPLRKQYRLAESHLIAVGTEGHDTPAGVYFVIDKKAHPSYTVPDADLGAGAGLDARRRVPAGDVNNPIPGAFLQLTEDPTGNIGIHGTAHPETLGTDASHGLRPRPPDVSLSLHRRIARQTPVVIL